MCGHVRERVLTCVCVSMCGHVRVRVSMCVCAAYDRTVWATASLLWLTIMLPNVVVYASALAAEGTGIQCIHP